MPHASGGVVVISPSLVERNTRRDHVTVSVTSSRDRVVHFFLDVLGRFPPPAVTHNHTRLLGYL